MSHINGAYSVESRDDIIEPYADNGEPRVENRITEFPNKLEKIPAGPFKDRVLDAISMLKEGFGQLDVQDRHGVIVYRQAKRLVRGGRA